MGKYPGITEAAFTAAMKAAVKERGADYIYPADARDADGNCVYSLPDGTPACLIGVALSKINADYVPKDEPFGGTPAAGALASLGAPPLVQRAAQRAQNMQDCGRTWGAALDRYLKILTVN